MSDKKIKNALYTKFVDTDVRSYEERYNACWIDLAFKTGAGLLLGSMVGSFFLRGFGRWPLFVGGGIGVGMAYTNCENSLNNYLKGMQIPGPCTVKKIP